MKKLLEEFKRFVMKGNLVTLAVAFILGLSFAAVVASFTDDIIMPFIGAIVGETSFADLTLEIGDGVIAYGEFLTVLLNFLIVAFVLFLVVKAYDAMVKKSDEPEPLTVEGELLAEIRDLLKSRSA